MPSPAEWHARFQHQASWTFELRRYLLRRLQLPADARILEVGCGTGAITAQIRDNTHAGVYGLDINPAFLRLARRADSITHFTAGDGLRMPFPAGAFDVVYCHFFLLWIGQPAAALAEMVRAARPGGWVLALAEPDYGGRIDYPPPLDVLGRLQTEALRQQGAEPLRGRQLSALFHAAGLTQVETGLLGGQWQSPPAPQARESEWQTLATDLADTLTPGQLAAYRSADEQAWESGARILFVPTFYALGRKPGQSRYTGY